MTTAVSPRVAGRHLIAGQWQAAAGSTFESLNPARLDDVLGVFPRGTAAAPAAAAAAADLPPRSRGRAVRPLARRRHAPGAHARVALPDLGAGP